MEINQATLTRKLKSKTNLWILTTVRHMNSDLVKHHCIFEPWCTWKYSATSLTPVYMGLKKGEDQGKEGGKNAIGQLGDSFLRMMDREAGTRMSDRHQTGLIS